MKVLIDSINLNHLRVFDEVFKTRSMTLAAKNLHLTQSGVSQHIRSLEESLGAKLFDRVNQRLIPSAFGKSLYEEVNTGLNSLENALHRIQDGKELSGMVSIGTPIEFGNNLLIPLLSKFSLEHKKVKFQLVMDYASSLNDMLLEGRLDFAFVDDYRMDKRIHTEIVYQEILDLCIMKQSLSSIPKNADKAWFETLNYVEYKTGEPLLRSWMEHHIKVKNFNPTVKAFVMDVQGIARFITQSDMAGILPRHLHKRLQNEGHALHIFEGSGKDYFNNISAAYIKDRTQSHTTRSLLNWLSKELYIKASSR